MQKYNNENDKNDKVNSLYSYPYTAKEIFDDVLIELQKYNYHKLKLNGNWYAIKNLCNWSYSLYDTDYLNNVIDNYLDTSYKMLNGNKGVLSGNKGVLSGNKDMVNTISRLIIKYVNKNNYINNNNINVIELNKGGELNYFIENFKVPFGKRRTCTYYNYFKSFIFTDVIPESYKCKFNFELISIVFYLDNNNIVTLEDIKHYLNQ
jgi:hypothetical protein